MRASLVPLGACETSHRFAKPAAREPITYIVMMSPIFAGRPPSAPVQFNAQQALRLMFMISAGFALFFLIPLFIFITPYHAIRERAALFDASPSCHDAAAPGRGATPCTIEWANVLKRYYSSGSKKGSHVSYYLQVRGGYGDEHTVDLKNEMIFWRTQNGMALKLQRWGDRITAVQLTSGESSETAQNPDWQLRNEIRGVNVILVLELVMIGIAIAAQVGLRQIRG
jgi:hypothetical protein